MKFLVLAAASHVANGGQLELDASNYLKLEAQVNEAIRQPLSDEAYEKMSQSLYLLIQRTMEQIDKKETECHEEQEATTKRIEELGSDLSGLWGESAHQRAELSDANGQIRTSSELIEGLETERKTLEAECIEEEERDKVELDMLTKHVKFMDAVKRSVACPKKGSFLQTTTRTSVKRCSDGTIAIFSPVGEATNANANVPGVDRNYGGKVKAKCTLSKMGCLKTYDLAHALTGEVEDSEKEMESEMVRKAQTCKQRLVENNMRFTDSTNTKSNAQTALAAATAELAITEALTDKKEQEMRYENRELTASKKECKSKLDEMKYTDLCIYSKLRKKLADQKQKPIPRDCQVGEWVTAGCSNSCGGGTETLTREIILSSSSNGVACPALVWTRSCGSKPCPEECKVDEWSNWSSCTTDCGGGIQSKTRELLKRSRYGAPPCNTIQNRVCNTASCSRDCTLHGWSKWSPCTRACGGGVQHRKRRVHKHVIGDGTCPHKDDKVRLRTRSCNPDACPTFNPTCAVSYDVVIAVDSSGSWGSAEAFEPARQVAIELSSKFDHVGVVQFSDMAKTLGNAEELAFVGGGTRLAAGLIAAKNQLQNTGRGSVPTLIFVITDAMTTSYRFEVKKVSKELDQTGARIVLMAVYKDSGHPPHYKLTNELQHLLHVDDADVLVEPSSRAASMAVLATCQDVVEAVADEEE